MVHFSGKILNMKKIILTLGSIAGVILVVMMALSIHFMSDGMNSQSLKYGELVGYATMIIALSLIFFGIRSYRDSHLDGRITFSKAFQVGISITLVASAIYVVGWMLISNLMAPDFMDQYAKVMIQSMQDSGASPEEIERTQSQMDSYRKMYENPLLKVGLTFMEVFPVGLLISLLSSLILKKR
jgi:hypothetical protein